MKNLHPLRSRGRHRSGGGTASRCAVLCGFMGTSHMTDHVPRISEDAGNHFWRRYFCLGDGESLRPTELTYLRKFSSKRDADCYPKFDSITNNYNRLPVDKTGTRRIVWLFQYSFFKMYSKKWIM